MGADTDTHIQGKQRKETQGEDGRLQAKRDLGADPSPTASEGTTPTTP